MYAKNNAEIFSAVERASPIVLPDNDDDDDDDRLRLLAENGKELDLIITGLFPQAKPPRR